MDDRTNSGISDREYFMITMNFNACRNALATANLDHSHAQFHLGRLYHSGIGMPEDHTEAASWYRKSADNCYARVTYEVGLCPETDDRILEFEPGAISYFRAAVERRNAGRK
jgi:TPR repeat protein